MLKSSFINISEALKLAKASPKVITLFQDFALEKERVAENYQQELIKAKDEVLKAKDEVLKAKDELSDLRSELHQLKSDGISFQEVFHLAYFRSFQGNFLLDRNFRFYLISDISELEHWETEVKDILWPGINVKNVSRSTLYDAIKKGNTFIWRKGFVPIHDDPAMALKNARKTAQDIKDLFEDCDVPDFDQVASKSYSEASRLIHLVYTDYFRRYVFNLNM